MIVQSDFTVLDSNDFVTLLEYKLSLHVGYLLWRGHVIEKNRKWKHYRETTGLFCRTSLM